MYGQQYMAPVMPVPLIVYFSVSVYGIAAVKRSVFVTPVIVISINVFTPLVVSVVIALVTIVVLERAGITTAIVSLVHG
jgi:hypothetical protein